MLLGERVLPLAPRDAALLAWLAIEGPTPRGRLAALLWADSETEAARNSLRQRLFQLRKLAGTEVVAGSTTITLAAGIAHDLADAAGVLGDARFEGSPELAAWLAQQRANRIERRRIALVLRADQAEQAHDSAAALAHSQALLELEPLSEVAHRRLMRLHYLRGDRAAALLAFDRCEKLLKDEVGTTPSAPTLALLATIEQAAPAVAVARRDHPVPASVLRPPRLVGRAGLLRQAQAAWSTGRHVAFAGEAGMGKSRLLQELLAGPARFAQAAARPGDAAVPYASLARLLREVIALQPEALAAASPPAWSAALGRLLPEVVAAPGSPALPGLSAAPEAQRLALQRSVITLLAAAADAGLSTLALDDLHFADAATLDMLPALLRPDARLPLRWAFARRPAEGLPGLDALFEGLLEDQLLEPLTLDPLTPAQLAELVATLGLPGVDATALAAQLHQHTGGNPLFALETLRQAWVDERLSATALPRPVSVTRLIERRLSRLSPQALRLARCAAIAGTEFSIELAAQVLRVPAIDLSDAWNELQDSQVFHDGAFAHDLIYEAARAGVPAQIAQHLHAEVAAHLQASAVPAAAVAAHWLAAGRSREALPFLRSAAQQASAQRRFGEAADACEREATLRLELDDAAGAFEAASAMRLAAFEVDLDLGGRSDHALALMLRAARGALQTAFAHAERAAVCAQRGDMTHAEEAAQAGLAALDSATPSERDSHPATGPDAKTLRVELLRHLAQVRAWQNRTPEAQALLEPVVALALELPSPMERFLFAQAYSVLLDHVDRCAEATQWGRRAVEIALPIPHVPGAAQVLLNLAIAQRDVGRLDTATQALDEAQALIASLPEGAMPYASLDINQGIVQRDRGHYESARDWFGRALERMSRHASGWMTQVLAHRAQTWALLGQHARALQDLAAADARAEAPLLARLTVAKVRAMVALALRQDSAEAVAQLSALQPPGGRPLSAHRTTLIACAQLEPGQVLGLAGEVLEWAIATGRGGVEAGARTRLIEAHLAFGQSAQAARHARRILGLLADPEAGCDELYRGDAWLAAARGLANEAPDESKRAVADAVDWIRTIARDHVADEFRDGFLQRNPANRELLAMQARMTA